MNSTDGVAAEQQERLRGLVTVATQRLLGDTIEVADYTWRAPSALPEWTRAHVASHLARQADALVRLVTWARSGERQDMYASPEQRTHDIEAGAGRTGLELQIDLDTSAGALEAAFDSLEEAQGWDAVVQMRGGISTPARLLPLARLLEVVIHHVDLDIGYAVTDIDPLTAEWLLEWCAFRLRDRDDFPKLELTADSGFTIAVGSSGAEPIAISGSSPNLLGWLMNRVGASVVSGDEGLQLPAF